MVDLSDPKMSEVERAVRRLKNNKSPDYDEILAEKLKAGRMKLNEWLLRVCIAVWKSGMPL